MTEGTAAGGRQIVALAVPALVVLAAEPLYLLFDTAVVGRLGALSLAGLAIGGLILGLVASQATFLSYGTTARAARHFGAGDRRAAVAEGVQATWLALGLGALTVMVVQISAAPVVAAVAGRDSIAQAALPWLRIAILGAPAILVSLAGNGWLRGVQDTSRPPLYVVAGFALSAVLCPVLVFGALGLPNWGLAGSAIANCAGQWLSALLFLRALGSERISLRLDSAVLRSQLVMGRDLIVRSLAFQACFVSAAAVAARFGAAALAAHQIVLQLWTFLALVLDSLAIAAQALVGAALGAGDGGQARSVAARVTAFSALAAGILAALLAAGSGILPGLFTGDGAVLTAIAVPWWYLVAQLPIAGIVFALDGVLLGAGDAAFMRTATVLSALIGFLPLIWISLALHWGLAGIWSGLSAFIVLRLLFVGWRALSGRWVQAGRP
ncbi:MATE family efflux transporter [Mycolicibacter minnesotensis]|uniref:MATE family efflux transporter n=1 Tax=Mycolicibacter minnesotensis TaxID=1118379 RepID=A0A7I7R245_9MYCO|nr:MATE family efflux transporter [Mycolicibacter minnesotensis]ORA97484.1 MATE family efflux transporter [Mycolicibacter minnesotensis]BBY32206.1 DNA-damage-inducible protein DinF [Mycolicibacter minnesotensis]